MSAFTHGFNHGFMHGMFNNMFGAGWCNPFMCWNSTPMFFTPSYNFGGFYQYQTPVPPMNMSVFNYNTPSFNNNFAFNTTPQADFSWQSNFSKTTEITPDWGDMFVSNKKADKTKKHGTTAKYSDNDTSNYNYDANELKKKWDKKKSGLSQEFYNKVVQVSKRINCNPNDLMGLMNSESGLDSTAENKIGAVGLIQFLPKTAASLFTSPEQAKKMSKEEQLIYSKKLKSMSAVEQLDYVEKFLTEAKRTAGYSNNQKIGPGTLYALTFLPGYAKNDILAEKEKDPNKYYAQNSGLDLNKDGKITKADLARQIKDKQA